MRVWDSIHIRNFLTVDKYENRHYAPREKN
jgi:hypothetical protein